MQGGKQKSSTVSSSALSTSSKRESLNSLQAVLNGRSGPSSFLPAFMAACTSYGDPAWPNVLQMLCNSSRQQHPLTFVCHVMAMRVPWYVQQE